jgi:prenyltransferase beta subunit
MKNKSKYTLYLFVGLFLGSIILFPSVKNHSEYTTIEGMDKIHQDLTPATGDNKELLDSIFNAKIFQYYEKGYFPQIYEPSLQATYYALYTLESVGKLHELTQSEVISYTMSHYEASSSCFKDELAYRYLDTDFTKTYFPLSTLLEVTCYAVLSLEILDSLNLIDISNMIDFIWSCYNPSTGGFIGQPYDAGLDDGFKIATADNTYFAVITLDLLMDDWLGYSLYKDNIIAFINGLQIPMGNGWKSGGFNNDEDGDFDSLLFHVEPNLLSSYYCLKTLEIFGMEDTINEEDFYQFLGSLYDVQYNYYHISEIEYGANYTNIVATALGLELANITGFTEYNRSQTLSFVLNNRNSLGNWDQSTSIEVHELIDTFQIIRSLNNVEAISYLLRNDREQIGNATLYYQSYQGFSHVSEDYTSLNLLYSIIGSFGLYNRISELDIQALYNMIKNSYINTPADQLSRTIYGYVLEGDITYWFRSHPIEYYTSSQKNYFHDNDQINSHQGTYYGLSALSSLFKLDDFASTYNLIDLISDIVDTQFLNDSYYDTFGAFSSLVKYTQSESEFINARIYCDFTYYAIRSLELLSNYLGINLDDIDIDITALYTYIDRNMVETPTMLYFNPHYANDVETILKTTYYMVYVLHAVDLYNKNSQKIKNYVEGHLDYSNIKNIYYSYKLSELLGLNIEFDFHLIQTLVQDIYSDEFHEFYLTSERKQIEQEIFLWICNMARTSEIEIEAQYSDPCSLGGINHMQVSLHNLILRDFGTYITFKFESAQIGTYIFSKLSNNSYVYDIPIPLSSINYPTVEGYLRAYEGAIMKAELYVSFCTNYTLDYTVKSNYDLTSFAFEINASLMANDQYFPTPSGSSYMKVYRDNEYVHEIQATLQDFSDYSQFQLIYHPLITGQYRFDVYLHDGISGSVLLITSTTYNIDEIVKNYDNEITGAIPLSIIFIAGPGIVIFFSNKKLKKAKKE